MKIDRRINLDSVDSTNEYLKRMQPADTVAVRAKTQTAGRGRLGRQWLSPIGGLYFSIIMPVQKQYFCVCTALAALAVAKAIPKTTIKWPNDILYNGKKLCGILCCGLPQSGRVIVGIGLNTDSTPLEAAASLHSFCTMDGDTVYKAILSSAENVYTRLENGEKDELLKEYHALLDTIGKTVTVIYNGNETTGKAIGINADAALIVQTDGEEITVFTGEATIKKD